MKAITEEEARQYVLDVMSPYKDKPVNNNMLIEIRDRLNFALQHLFHRGMHIYDRKRIVGQVIGIDVEIVNNQYNLIPIYKA